MSSFPFDESARHRREDSVCSTVVLRRVVVIADAVLEDDIQTLIAQMGFLAQSSVDCSSRSLGSVADNGLSKGRVRIEALGTADIARELMRNINDGAFRGHSIFTYLDSVEVDERVALR